MKTPTTTTIDTVETAITTGQSRLPRNSNMDANGRGSGAFPFPVLLDPFRAH